jgi:hypothetical protein
MFFDELDEGNTMVESILAFDEVGGVSLADLGSLLRRLDQARLDPLSFWLTVFFLDLFCIYLTSTMP